MIFQKESKFTSYQVMLLESEKTDVQLSVNERIRELHRLSERLTNELQQLSEVQQPSPCSSSVVNGLIAEASSLESDTQPGELTIASAIERITLFNAYLKRVKADLSSLIHTEVSKRQDVDKCHEATSSKLIDSKCQEVESTSTISWSLRAILQRYGYAFDLIEKVLSIDDKIFLAGDFVLRALHNEHHGSFLSPEFVYLGTYVELQEKMKSVFPGAGQLDVRRASHFSSPSSSKWSEARYDLISGRIGTRVAIHVSLFGETECISDVKSGTFDFLNVFYRKDTFIIRDFIATVTKCHNSMFVRDPSLFCAYNLTQSEYTSRGYVFSPKPHDVFSAAISGSEPHDYLMTQLHASLQSHFQRTETSESSKVGSSMDKIQSLSDEELEKLRVQGDDLVLRVYDSADLNSDDVCNHRDTTLPLSLYKSTPLLEKLETTKADRINAIVSLIHSRVPLERGGDYNHFARPGHVSFGRRFGVNLRKAKIDPNMVDKLFSLGLVYATDQMVANSLGVCIPNCLTLVLVSFRPLSVLLPIFSAYGLRQTHILKNNGHLFDTAQFIDRSNGACVRVHYLDVENVTCKGPHAKSSRLVMMSDIPKMRFLRNYYDGNSFYVTDLQSVLTKTHITHPLDLPFEDSVKDYYVTCGCTFVTSDSPPEEKQCTTFSSLSTHLQIQ